MIAPIAMQRIPTPVTETIRMDPFHNAAAMTGARNELAIMRALDQGPCRTVTLEQRCHVSGGVLHRAVKRLEADGMIGKTHGLQGRWYLRSVG